MQGDLLDQAAAARLNGDGRTAASLCQQVLADDPNNPNAKSLLGVCFAEAGQTQQARPLVEAALATAPDNWRFLLNYSVLQEAEGDMPGARASAEKAAAAAPERFEPWGRLGDICGKLEDFAGAADALGKAIAINPEQPMLALLLAGARYEIADYEGANEALDLFERYAPGHPHALRLRTHIARQTSNWEGLIACAKAWLAASPEEEAARVALAYAYSQPGFYARAVEAYKPLADQEPPNADHLATLGKYLLGARDLDEAERYYRRALEVDPNHAEAAAGIGRIMTFLGRFDAAADYSRQAIKNDPRNVEAYGQLALATNGRLDDAEIEQLKRLGGDESLQLEHRALSWYAAGDALHRRKQRAPAFEAWAEASRLKYALGDSDADARYARADYEAMAERIMRVFPNDHQGSDAERARRPAPIFIVGMPRSGTTLLESALAAHPDVACAGELPVMPFAQREFFAWADEAGWNGGEVPRQLIEAIRQKYFDQYREYGIESSPFITDKQPNNFLCVGLIRRAFPEARIIHIRRNPMETGFSIFRRNFTRSWKFANSLLEIGHYYGLHSRLTAHWARTLGDNLAFVQYEDMVRDFEGELRRLVAFCGLEWNRSCLEYYKQERTVITFSATQVRKPPSPEHLNSTAPYEEFLGPLKSALQAAGVDLETGALRADA